MGTMAGKFERRDAGDHTQRLAQRVDVDAGRSPLAELPLQQLGNAAGEFDDLQATGNLAGGVGPDLAVLRR